MSKFVFFLLVFISLFSVTSFGQKKGSDKVKFVPMEKKAWEVHGQVSATNFMLALLPGYSSYMLERVKPDSKLEDVLSEEFTTVDENNDFIEYYFEGDSMTRMQLCYWHRTDGSILVAFFSDNHWFEEKKQTAFKHASSQICFFIYNKATKMLIPIPSPYSLKVGKKQHFCCELPRHGKDIKYNITAENADDSMVGTDAKILKFDGMRFIP